MLTKKTIVQACSAGLFFLSLCSPSWAGGDAAKGKTLFQQKCISCHGANGEGKASMKAPRLAGQFDWYLVTQLKNFRDKKRLNPAMLPFLRNLTDQDFEDLSAHISQLK
jgi:cytochrome c553